jgi:hypothetical protein
MGSKNIMYRLVVEDMIMQRLLRFYMGAIIDTNNWVYEVRQFCPSALVNSMGYDSYRNSFFLFCYHFFQKLHFPACKLFPDSPVSSNEDIHYGLQPELPGRDDFECI